MRTINGKLFLYELKRILILPGIIFAVYVLMNCGYLLNNGKFNGDWIKYYDEQAESFLYLFYALLIVGFVYTTLSMRRLYAKVRIDPERLLLYRMVCVTLACVVFTFVELALGSARVALFKRNDPEAYLRFGYECMFAFQNKSVWYFLFAFSVGATGLITCAFIQFFVNLYFSPMKWWQKVLWGIAYIAMTIMAHYVFELGLKLQLVGANDPFAYAIPVGTHTYTMYAQCVRLENTMQLCHLSWNILNLTTLLSGAVMTAIGYFSLAIFSRGVNDGYLYVVKEKKEEHADENTCK